MKLATRITILAIVLAAASVAVVFLNHPKGDRLTLHFVDEDTGKPINGRATILEYRPYPLLSSLKFLPSSLQAWLNTRSVPVHDGFFRVTRIRSGQKRQFELRVENFRTYHFEYFATTNGHALFATPKSHVTLRPGQVDASIRLFQP